MTQEEIKTTDQRSKSEETKDEKGITHKGQKKFRNKVFLVFIFISLVPLLIISSSSLFIIIKTRQENISEMQNLAINNAYEKITKYLNQKMEGLNLVVSGKQNIITEKIPEKLTEVNPNNLIFLLQKRWQKENSQKAIESINFLDNEGNIILKTDKSGQIILKKYFSESVFIIYKNVSQSNNIYDPAISGSKIFEDQNGKFKIEYRGEEPIISVSSAINNQNGSPIGKIVTQINLRKINDQFKGGMIIEKTVDALSSISPDNLILLLKEGGGQLSEKIKINSATLNSLSYVDKTGETLGRIENSQITMRLYGEINTMDSSVQFDQGQILRIADLDSEAYQNILKGINFLEVYRCNECQDKKILIKVYSPIKNKKNEILGATESVLDFTPVNISLNNSKLGEATKKISEMDPNNLIYLLKSVKQTSGSDGSVTKVRFIDNDGEVLASINQNDEITIKKDYWSSYIPQAKIADAYLPGLTESDFVEANAVNEEGFKMAIYGNKFLSKFEIKDKQPTMTLASQFENSDRERIGIVSAEIDLTPIQNVIQDIKLGNTGYLYILDKKGIVIASQNEQFAKTGDNLADIPLIKDVLYGNVHDGKKYFDIYTNHNNSDVIFAGAPMMTSPAKEGVDWYILSEWPKDDAYSVINNILKISVAITLATLVIIIFLGMFFAGKIVKPIKSLVHGAQEIAKGNLDYKIKMKTHDEFDILTARFNDMVTILKENQKLRDEFVFISAHELRTPVTAIKGYLSMILDKTFGDVPPEIKSNLEIVNASNERLVQLVNDLLEVARSEAGKMKINMVTTPIFENINTVMNELRSLADKKGIKMAYDEPELSKLSVMADPYKLKEVLTNLIGNAIKYTLGNGDIQITHERKDNDLIIHIKDHGMGMGTEDVAKLFAKFYRVQNDKTANIEGTGLGLFICKEIVERMNGKIWVESEVGKGSTFSFSLEIAKNI